MNSTLSIAIALAAMQPQIRELTTPDQAVQLALADLQQPEVAADSTTIRWVWVRDGDIRKAQYVSQAANVALRHCSLPQQPIVTGNGYLVRIEMRRFAPSPGDLTRLLNVWEQGFGFNFNHPEPYFHEFFDKADATTVVSDAELRSGRELIAVIPAGSTIETGEQRGDWTSVTFSGKTGFVLTKLISNTQSIQVVKLAEHLDSGIAALKEATGSTVPIVEARWFMKVALSSVDGGQYYNFRGIERSTIDGGKVAKSALEKFVERAGADFSELERKANRLAMISEQTANWRRVDVWHGDLRRPKEGPAHVWLTFDVAESSRRGTEHPLRSLLSLKYDAIEAIILTDRGTEYALFSGNKGRAVDRHQLQNSAPDAVTKDHEIPAPHPARLEAAISCIRCHGKSRGFMPLRNEITPYLKDPRYTDIILEASSGRDVRETLDLTAGLYDWQPHIGDDKLAPPDDPLEVSRRSLDREVFRATVGLDTEDAFGGIADMFGEYKYKRVDAVMACEELGVRATAETAPQILKQLLGKAPGFESPIIDRLQNGGTVVRHDIEAELPTMFFRAKMMRRAAAQQQKGQADEKQD